MSLEKYIDCVEAYDTLRIYSAWIRMHSNAIFSDDVLNPSRTPSSNCFFPAMVELIQTHINMAVSISRGKSTLLETRWLSSSQMIACPERWNSCQVSTNYPGLVKLVFVQQWAIS